MDLAGRLQQLEELIREAKSMPLSSSVLVNREEVLEMIAGDAGGAARGDQAGPVGGQGPRGAPHQGPRRRPSGSSSRRARSSCGWCARRRSSLRREDGGRSRRRRGRAAGSRDPAGGRGLHGREARAVRDRPPQILEASQIVARSRSNRTLEQVEVGRERLRAPATAAEARVRADPGGARCSTRRKNDDGAPIDVRDLWVSRGAAAEQVVGHLERSGDGDRRPERGRARHRASCCWRAWSKASS